MDYSRVIATSIAQIRDKGRSVTLVYKTHESYDPGTDTFTGQTESEQTVKMVIKDYELNEIDQTMVKTGDRLGLLAPDDLDNEPETGDCVIDGSETLSIVAVRVVKPGDLPVLYKLQLRRGK